MKNQLNIKNLSLLFFIALITISCNTVERDWEKANEKNSIESYTEFISNHPESERVKEAIKNIDNQSALAIIVIENKNRNVSKLALKKINAQQILAEIILRCTDVSITDLAWVKLNDQSILMSLADTVEAARIRIRAVYKITDEDFLLKRSKDDISATVRQASVEQIKLEEKLSEVAINSYYTDLRKLAFSRITDKILLDSISKNYEEFNKVDSTHKCDKLFH